MEKSQRLRAKRSDKIVVQQPIPNEPYRVKLTGCTGAQCQYRYRLARGLTCLRIWNCWAFSWHCASFWLPLRMSRGTARNSPFIKLFAPVEGITIQCAEPIWYPIQTVVYWIVHAANLHVPDAAWTYLDRAIVKHYYTMKL